VKKAPVSQRAGGTGLSEKDQGSEGGERGVPFDVACGTSFIENRSSSTASWPDSEEVPKREERREVEAVGASPQGERLIRVRRISSWTGPEVPRKKEGAGSGVDVR